MTKNPSVEPPAAVGTDPSDESLTTVIDARDDSGEGQFQAVDAGDIRCLTCRQTFGADTQRADDVDRVEGASDPADAAIILGVRCPHCDSAGSLLVRYGPEASAEEADLLVGLRRRPADHGRPTAS